MCAGGHRYLCGIATIPSAVAVASLTRRQALSPEHALLLQVAGSLPDMAPNQAREKDGVACET
jgi:hypothetical protein